MATGKLDTSKIQKDIKKSLEKGLRISVGFRGFSNQGSRLIPLRDIAVWNFYGTHRIPSRNVLENVNLKGISKLKGVSSLANPKVKGNAKVFKNTNTFLKKKVKKAFDAKYKANAPSTIKRKGFNRPLIWTGKLRDSTVVSVSKRRE